jgi:predicted O-methyltransferase YrrM
MQTAILQAFAGPADPEVTALTRGNNDWAVSEAMAQYLFKLVLALKPRSVLEFGAGWSSVVIARALSRLNLGGSLTSLDHTDRFCGRAWEQVRREPNVDAVLSISDLRLHLGAEGLSYSYAAISQVSAQRGPFDLVFVDGPPGAYGRYGTVFNVRKHLAPGAAIVLDDAARRNETSAVKKWTWLLGGLKCQVHDTGFAKGIAVLTVERALRQTFRLQPFVRSFVDQLQLYRERRWHPEIVDPPGSLQDAPEKRARR